MRHGWQCTGSSPCQESSDEDRLNRSTLKYVSSGVGKGSIQSEVLPTHNFGHLHSLVVLWWPPLKISENPASINAVGSLQLTFRSHQTRFEAAGSVQPLLQNPTIYQATCPSWWKWPAMPSPHHPAKTPLSSARDVPQHRRPNTPIVIQPPHGTTQGI